MLFKKTTTQAGQMQTTEDDFHREVNGDDESEVYDEDETEADQPAQAPPQRTNPFPMKKTFSGLSSPSPVETTTAPITAPTAPEVQTPSPATVVSTSAAPQQGADRGRDPNLIQMTTKIDRALHGRLRYMSFKTGKTHAEIITELISQHCPEVP